jgi:hypothetical protein
MDPAPLTSNSSLVLRLAWTITLVFIALLAGFIGGSYALKYPIFLSSTPPAGIQPLVLHPILSNTRSTELPLSAAAEAPTLETHLISFNKSVATIKAIEGKTLSVDLDKAEFGLKNSDRQVIVNEKTQFDPRAEKSSVQIAKEYDEYSRKMEKYDSLADEKKIGDQKPPEVADRYLTENFNFGDLMVGDLIEFSTDLDILTTNSLVATHVRFVSRPLLEKFRSSSEKRPSTLAK